MDVECGVFYLGKVLILTIASMVSEAEMLIQVT